VVHGTCGGRRAHVSQLTPTATRRSVRGTEWVGAALPPHPLDEDRGAGWSGEREHTQARDRRTRQLKASLGVFYAHLL